MASKHNSKHMDWAGGTHKLSNDFIFVFLILRDAKFGIEMRVVRMDIVISIFCLENETWGIHCCLVLFKMKENGRMWPFAFLWNLVERITRTKPMYSCHDFQKKFKLSPRLRRHKIYSRCLSVLNRPHLLIFIEKKNHKSVFNCFSSTAKRNFLMPFFFMPCTLFYWCGLISIVNTHNFYQGILEISKQNITENSFNSLLVWKGLEV